MKIPDLCAAATEFVVSLDGLPMGERLEHLTAYDDQILGAQKIVATFRSAFESAVSSKKTRIRTRIDHVGNAVKPDAAEDDSGMKKLRIFMLPTPEKREPSVRAKAMAAIFYLGAKGPIDLARIAFGEEYTPENVQTLRSSLWPMRQQKILVFKNGRYRFTNKRAKEAFRETELEAKP